MKGKKRIEKKRSSSWIFMRRTIYTWFLKDSLNKSSLTSSAKIKIIKQQKKHTISTPSKQCRRFVVGGWLFFLVNVYLCFCFRTFSYSLKHKKYEYTFFLFNAFLLMQCAVYSDCVCVVFLYTSIFCLSRDGYFYLLVCHFTSSFT